MNKQKLIFWAAAIFGILAIVALIATIVFARTLGAYVSGGITVLIFSVVTYTFFGQLDHGAEAKAEVKPEPEKTDEAKTETTPAIAAVETPVNPSGLDEAVLGKSKDYFGEEYVKGINSQRDRVLREIDAGFNKGMKDAVEEYETACSKKLNTFNVNFKSKTSKGGDKDVKE